MMKGFIERWALELLAAFCALTIAAGFVCSREARAQGTAVPIRVNDLGDVAIVCPNDGDLLSQDGDAAGVWVCAAAGNADAVHKFGAGDPNAGAVTCANVGKDRYTRTGDSTEWYCSGVDAWTQYAGASFTPDPDPGVDHANYVAGHGDGANCAAGEIPLGVSAAGAVQGCYEPTTGDVVGYVAGHGDGANCSAGQIPLGVDAAGAVQGCYAAPTPGGSSGNVQYNDGGAHGGEDGFDYDDATDTLTVGAVTADAFVQNQGPTSQCRSLCEAEGSGTDCIEDCAAADIDDANHSADITANLTADVEKLADPSPMDCYDDTDSTTEPCDAGSRVEATDTTPGAVDTTHDTFVLENSVKVSKIRAVGGATGDAGVVLAPDAIGASEIVADAVGSSEIAANAVGNSEMADNAIGSAEVAPNSLVAEDLATNSVGTLEIADESVLKTDLSAMCVNRFSAVLELEPDTNTYYYSLASIKVATTAAPSSLNATQIAASRSGTRAEVDDWVSAGDGTKPSILHATMHPAPTGSGCDITLEASTAGDLITLNDCAADFCFAPGTNGTTFLETLVIRAVCQSGTGADYAVINGCMRPN